MSWGDANEIARSHFICIAKYHFVGIVLKPFCLYFSEYVLSKWKKQPFTLVCGQKWEKLLIAGL